MPYTRFGISQLPLLAGPVALPLSFLHDALADLRTDHLAELGSHPALATNESGQLATRLGAWLLGR